MTVNCPSFGPTWVTMVLWPTWLGLLQQDWRKPPHPPSTTPPASQQKRKNSQDPVRHRSWSPTKNLSLGGGRLLLTLGRVKKNLSWLFQEEGLGPELKSSLLTSGDASGKNSPNKSSSLLSLIKKSSNSSLLWFSSGFAMWNPTPMLSRRSWSFRTLKPRSKDKSCLVKSFDSGFGKGRGGSGPEQETRDER